ncbi:hypothetical protein F503_05827 [Ophiostoma piceae UAMH 11346]|uniref:Uncharacterized protein n=1 Tax=Ophiostoma piceae (strain UAMH 11346) TaxID=1262450 RepID=S3CCV6_OPHP1|nr:hypothetical protein F503_05827 [Ophiostoma piceae UAMH 11346]
MMQSLKHASVNVVNADIFLLAKSSNDALPSYIRSFRSISSWNVGTDRVSSPVYTSSQSTVVSRPSRMSSCTLGICELLAPLPPRASGRHSPSRVIFSSMPRRTGSAMPNDRRSVSMRRASRVASHCLRRASRGCAESRAGTVVEDWALPPAAAWTLGPTPLRRTS